MRSLLRPSRPLRGVFPLIALVLAAVGACKKPAPASGTVPEAVSAAPAASAALAVAPRESAPARWTGSALARDPEDKALYLADEDASLVRRVPLPLQLDGAGPFVEAKLKGPPAQIIARARELLVTVRDPSALVILVDETAQPGGTLREEATVALPGDAWGMALSPDELTLLVTSAWTHQVSVIDVKRRTVLATLDVPREPRGVVFAPDGRRAYVTHLIGTAITRIDVGGAASTATAVALPAGVTRAPRTGQPSASLAYAPVISEDGTRLYVPRHALGTLAFDASGGGGWSGNATWWGSSTIDILLLRDESPLSPKRASVAMVGRFGAAEGLPKVPTSPEAGALPMSPPTTFIQPRDAVFRHATRTLLVVSEGTDSLTEHDADSLDPGITADRYTLGEGYLTGKTKQPTADRGSAPQAIALSSDENTAYVWSRGSREISSVPLRSAPLQGEVGARRSLAQAGPFPEPLSKDAAAGRRLFYYADDTVMSVGLGCAGCHPDGRDDGFVWREGKHAESSGRGVNQAVFYAHPAQLGDPENDGRARQTPMLAGRVASDGPFGWHAQNKNLETRLLDGFALHRWSSRPDPPTAYEKAFRLTQLKAYLRRGLRAPPRDTRPLTPEEEKGRAVFEDDKTLCKSCHPAATEYTTRAPVPLKSPLPTRPGYFADEDQSFRVPSLLFVAGTAPYYHDGSASTLTELIDKNGNRMGNTSHLSADERAALVAYLGRL